MPKQRELNVLPRARIPVELTWLAEKHPAIMQRAFYDLNGPPLRTNRAEPRRLVSQSLHGMFWGRPACMAREPCSL